MSKVNGITKTQVKKMVGLWGCAPQYVSSEGTIYAEKHVLANLHLFTVEGRTIEQMEKQAKKSKSKKSSKKSSSSYTPSNAWRGSNIEGEMAYFSQFRQRCGATLDLVIRTSEVAL